MEHSLANRDSVELFTGLAPIGPQDVQHVWPVAAPLIDMALEHSYGECSLLSVLEDLLNRRSQLWFFVEDSEVYAVVVTSITNYPHRKMCNIDFMGGRNLEKAKTYLHEIEAWAISEGCQLMTLKGRKGFERELAELGYRHAYAIIGKELIGA